MGTREARKPKPPCPEQHQEPPGRESELRPRPRYEAPEYTSYVTGEVLTLLGGQTTAG